MQETKKNKNAVKNIRTGFVGLEFSKRILSKYTFSRKSGKLPSLIFLKLFSNKIESGQRRPHPKSKSIINYFRFHLSLYFGIVRKSMGIPGDNPIEHMSYIIEFIEPHLQLSEKELKRISSPVKKICSEKYFAGSEQKRIPEFLKIQSKRAGARYNFISMPEVFQPYGSKSDSFKISGLPGSSTSIQSQYAQTKNIPGKQTNSYFFPEFSYLNVFRQMMLHMHCKAGKNYGNLLSKNKEIKDINYFYASDSDLHDGPHHFSYLVTGPAKIALSPAASGYLQRNRQIEDAEPIRYNAASPAVFRKIKKDLGISGSLPGPAKVYSAMDSSNAGKKNNFPINQKRTVRDIRYEHFPGSDHLDSSYYFSYLMAGSAKIALSPAASGYLQKNSQFENTVSVRYNAASPVVFRKMNKEFGLLPGPAKVYSAMDGSDAEKMDILPIYQNRTIQDIRYEHFSGSDRHDSSYHLSHLTTGQVKIALSPAASGYLQKNWHLETTGLVRYNAASPVVFRKMNKEFSSSGSLPASAKIYSAMNRSDEGNTNNLPTNQDRMVRDIRYKYIPDRHDSSYHLSHLITGSAKVALGPAASGYLQRNRQIENAGSIRYNAASPVVFQKINKEFSISGSALYQSQNISIMRMNGQNKNLNFRDFTSNNTYNPSELVIKKASLQGTENLTRNAEEKIMPTRSTDHSIKDSIRPINEINRIADRVYHIIERKISIEKDRRGLL